VGVVETPTNVANADVGIIRMAHSEANGVAAVTALLFPQSSQQRVTPAAT
jgi:hypothetical protein